MVPSVNPIQPAEPRKPAANMPNRESDPFSELLEAAAGDRNVPGEKQPEAAKRSEPAAAPSQAPARSESLARGETPDAAKPMTEDTSRPTVAPEEALTETTVEFGGAAETSDAVDVETPDFHADEADTSGQRATLPSATPVAVASVNGEGSSPTENPEVNATAEAETPSPVGDIQDSGVQADANADPAPSTGRDKQAQAATVPTLDGAADATDIEDQAPTAPMQAVQSMKQASTSAQTQAAVETAAPEAENSSVSTARRVSPQTKEQNTASQPALPNNSTAVASADTTTDPGNDANAVLPQPQSATPTAQAKPDDVGTVRAGENPASPSLPPVSDAAAPRAQQNTPAANSTEPVRALAASLNPASIHAANAVDTDATLLTGRALAVEIISNLRAGKQQFEIRLDPPELGRVDVRLEMDRAGNVTTKMTVDRPETLELMQREARGLERALQSAGLKTDAGGLEFSLRSHAQTDFAGARDRSSNPEPRSDLIAIDEGARVEAAAESYRAAAFARGGVDIRV